MKKPVKTTSAMPLYTRGWRGLLLTLMFMVLLVIPSVSATFVWLVVAIMSQT